MLQAKFSLNTSQMEFLNHHKAHGFKDRSAMVRAALERLKKELELQSLKESAELYSEIYATDAELQEWTKATAEGWPE